MYKAIFIDLDGTLLRKNHSISEATRDVIRKAVSTGIIVVLVSARPYHGITSISDWLGNVSIPIVSLNGAYTRLENNIIFESSIDLRMVADIRTQSLEFDSTLIYYSGEKWFAETSNAATNKEQRITHIKVNIAPFDFLLKEWNVEGININKVMAIGKADVIDSFESQLLSMFKKEMNIYTSKPTYLEMMRKDASKSNAVKFMLDRYKIKPEEIIAIGDNFNDKEMIIFAGTGIAMGNAPDAIKAVADYVTDTNENDGVRKAIEKFIPL